MKPASTLALLASLLAVSSVQAKWSRIPIIKEKPVDIAVAGGHSSASLDSSTGFGQVDNLLTDDITKAATVSAGQSFAVINLGKPVLISQSSFTNDGIEGKATLSASADKNGWAVLEEKVFSAADRTVEFKFAGMQAKFIKLEFALSKGGMIRGLHFYGSQTDKGYAVKQSADGKGGKPMNLIGGLGGARVIYAAPKAANGDSAITFNKFSFPESDEKYRTIIYDFGQLRILNEFGSVHSPRPVRFEVFAFDALPEKEDWRGRLAFDPSDFNTAKPVAVAEDAQGLGTLKAKPSKPVKTRYLALRWEPDFNPPNFNAEGSSMGNVSSITTSTTTTTKNADGTTTTVTTEVGDAFGAGAGDSAVTGDNPQQNASQTQAASGDTARVTTTVTNTETGAKISEKVEAGNTTSTTTYDSNGNVSGSTTETKNTDGSTTTTTTDAAGNTTTTTSETPNGTPGQSDGGGGGNTPSGSNTNTSGDGNLGAGSSPSPTGPGAVSTSSTSNSPPPTGSPPP